MKIRTDFVTNSSSSNYCVSFCVEMNNGKVIDLDPWPEDADVSEDIYCPIHTDVGELAEGIKGCSSVEALKQLLVSTVDQDDEGPASGFGKELAEFCAGLDSIGDIGDIKSVTINEFFTGWGEFARDGIDDFMSKAIPEVLDWEDEEAVREALEGRFTDDEISALTDQVLNDSCCSFDASIDTVVNMADREIRRSFSFDDLT